MRRTTTAWIAGTLGAGLTASIVLAQQLPQSRSSGGGALGRVADGRIPAPLYGAGNWRGGRYLLRNGLDYLQYQQYERALRFLRDAENHVKELTAPEKLALKKGIEQAQNGLRAAADSQSPYALSERSQPSRGFTVARPETAIASSPASPFRADSRGRSDRPVAHSGNEPAGEPIRLTSVEAPKPPRPRREPARLRSGTSSTASGPQAAVSEIPTLTAPEIPTLTAVPSSNDPAVPGLGANPPSTADPALVPASPSQPVTSSEPSSSPPDRHDVTPPPDASTQAAAALPILPSDLSPPTDQVNVSGSGQPVPRDPAVAGAATATATVLPEGPSATTEAPCAELAAGTAERGELGRTGNGRRTRPPA